MTTFLLNPAQQKAVTHDAGPLLIIAGAGTGKTRVLTERIVYLISEDKCNAREVLALAFNNDAARELESRVLEKLPFGAGFPNVTTFHAFCLDLLREYGLEIGLATNGEVMEEIESYLFLRENFSELPLNYFLTPNADELIHRLLKHFELCKKEDISPEAYVKFCEENKWEDSTEQKKYSELAECYATYEAIKNKNGKLEFNDLHYYTLRLLRSRPHVLKQIQKRYKYILVDEYQDTDPVQNEIINLLAKEHQNLTVVGDDDQCIYRFRGASIENIMSFKDYYPTATEITLTENYRSHQQILDLAYTSIQFNNPHRLEAKLNLNKKLLGQTKDPNCVSFKQFAHGNEEFDYLAQEIKKLIKSGNNYQDIAILVRKTSHAAEIEQALTLAGIPSQFVGARGLYNQPEITRLLAIMEAIVLPHDQNALYNFLRLPEFQIPMEEIYPLLQKADRTNLSILGLFKSVAETSPIFKLAYDKLKLFTEYSRDKTALETAFYILEEMGWKEELIKNQDNPATERQILNLNKFLNRIKTFGSKNTHADLLSFYNYFKLVREAGENPQTADFDYLQNAVTISTVHRSKGLEWPIVFLPYLVKGDFPAKNQTADLDLPKNFATQTDEDPKKTHEAEERRLFYVALTRAKHRLFLSMSDSYRELKQKKTISPFLQEIGYTAKTPDKGFINPLLLSSATQGEELPGVAEKEFTNFSYSLVEAYRLCPRKVYYMSIASLPTLPSARQQFGTQIHGTLQEFMNLIKNQETQPALFPEEEKEISEQTLQKIWQKKFTPYWYHDADIAEKYRERGKEICTWFFAEWSKSKTIPLALEKSFRVALGGVVLKGRFDRIDPGTTQDSCIIIDYKTGRAKDQEDVDENVQLSFYALVSQQALGLKAEKMRLIYLPDQTIVDTTRTPKQLKKEEAKILNTIEQIKSKDFTAKPNPRTCGYCDYKNVCPHSQAKD